MVAFPAIVKKPGQEKAAPAAAGGPQIFYVSNSWPWESEEELEYPHIHAPLPAPVFQPSKPTNHKQRQLYSLSSHAHSSSLTNSSSTSTSSSSRSRSRRSHSHSPATVLSASPSPIQQFTSLWDDDDDDEAASSAGTDLPPIHPSDYMKTLVSQLAATISSIKTAYAHQQTALMNPYNMLAINGDEGARAVVSKTDKAMVEELQSLSHLHSQLALLPHVLTFKEGAEVAAVEVEKDTMMLQIKRYEGIITRFHDEIWRKKAVTEALKETLVKSMLKGEKLQQQVQALEAKLALHTH